MKLSSLFASILLISLLAPQVLMGAWYVKPSAEVPVRRGQGNDYKIIAVVNSGTEVRILEEQDDWARVRLASGKEGWILKRYLDDQPPLSQVVDGLRREKESLIQELEASKNQVEELTRANEQAQQELTGCMSQRDQARQELAALKKDTADVVRTKQQLSAARQQLKQDQERISELTIENSALKKNSTLMWFLAGAGVLLIGWIIGLITCRNKRRRNTLL